MLRRWFTPSALFAATLAVAPVASAGSYHSISTDSCRQVAAADGTAPWCLGKTVDEGEYEAYYWDSGWQATSTYGTWISTMWNGASKNYPLLITNDPSIIVGTPAGSDIGATTTFTWSTVGGTATSISGAGAWYMSGSGFVPLAYVTGTSGTNHTIECSSDGSGSWSTFAAVSPSGAGTQVAVSQDGTDVWAITSTKTIYRLVDGFQYFVGSAGPCDSEGSWSSISGSAAYISAGAGVSSSVPAWIIGTTGDVYEYDSSLSPPWNHIANNSPGDVGPDGIATSVSVGEDGNVWLTDSNFDVWEYY